MTFAARIPMMHDVLIQIRAAFLCIGLIFPVVAVGADRDYLFSPLSEEARMSFNEESKVDLKNDPTIRRMVGASLNAETLLNNVIHPSLVRQPIRPVVANLFDDVSPMTIITERVRELEPNSFEWVGHVEGDLDSRAIFVVREGKPSMLTGTIAARDRFFRIGSNQKGIHAIFELDLSKLPNESPPRTKSLKNKSVPVAPAGQQIRPIEMSLSDDLPVMTVITDRVEDSKQDYLEWYGHLEGDPTSSSVIILKKEGHATQELSIVSGVIHTRERIYRIGRDWPVPPPGPPDLPDLPIVHIEKILPPIKFATELFIKPPGPCRIDVMVAYTPQAKDASMTDIDEDIQSAFVAAQDALYDSDVHFELHRAGKDEVKKLYDDGEFQYVDNGSITKDLSALTYLEGDIADTMAKLHTIRDTVGADLVSLWIRSGLDDSDPPKDSCGASNFMETLDPAFEASAFSVVPRYCVTEMSFLHELAHNMGAHHDRGSFDPPVTSTEGRYGFVNSTTSNLGPWGTIMAMRPHCPTNSPYASTDCRVSVFSNPDIDIGGMMAGKAAPAADAADNHWTLNNAREIVAGFRQPAAMFGECAAQDLTPPAPPGGLIVK